MDHKPLTSSITKSHSTSTWSQRAEHHLLFISQFTTLIHHVARETYTPPSPPPSSTSQATTTAGRTGVIEAAAGLPVTCPSITGVGDVRQVFDLSTSLPADEVGIELAALQAAQMSDAEAAQLLKLKGFNFSYVMFKEISLLCDILTGVSRPVVPAEFR